MSTSRRHRRKNANGPCATCHHHFSAHAYDPVDQGRAPPKKCTVKGCLCLCYRRPGEITKSWEYTTTFCNQLHRLLDGKPVEHNCFILRTDALWAETEGRYKEIIDAGGMIKQPPREMVRGVRSLK